MSTTAPIRNKIRYKLVVDGEVLMYDFTTDLERCEKDHRIRYPTAQLEQVGDLTTHEIAWHWAKEWNETI